MADETHTPEGTGVRPPAGVEDRSIWSAYNIDVTEDAEHSQFEALLNGYEVGKLAYHRVGQRLVLLGIIVVTSFRGNGISTELTARSLARIQETGRTITVRSPEVRAFLDAHPAYEHLVDTDHPGLPRNPGVMTENASS
jgi:predicted GNAT family acetyltransferase